jgi:transcriptional regulator with XRE-family HTH domain
LLIQHGRAVGIFLRIRVKRGIAQERLAYDSGVDRSYVGGLERQTENPTIDLLERLAETFDVPLAELFVISAGDTAAPKTLPKGRKTSKLKRKKS